MSVYLRLPDDPDLHDHILEQARAIDPEAKIYDLPPPKGPHLEVSSLTAKAVAKLCIEDNVEQGFKL